MKMDEMDDMNKINEMNEMNEDIQHVPNLFLAISSVADSVWVGVIDTLDSGLVLQCLVLDTQEKKVKVNKYWSCCIPWNTVPLYTSMKFQCFLWKSNFSNQSTLRKRLTVDSEYRCSEPGLCHLIRIRCSLKDEPVGAVRWKRFRLHLLMSL